MANIEKDGNCLRVSGAMTMASVEGLLARSAPLFNAENLEVDLADVNDVDSAAISAVFEWLRQAHARNISLMFVNLPENLASLASLYGVLDLIPHHKH